MTVGLYTIYIACRLSNVILIIDESYRVTIPFVIKTLLAEYYDRYRS